MIFFNEVNIGDRFAIKGCNYEVAFVNNQEIRAASVAGGKIFTLSKENFLNFQKTDELKIIRSSKTNETTPANINETQKKEMNKRLSYVRYIIDFAEYTRSSKVVSPLLKEALIK